MGIYEDFASVYDEFMETYSAKEWADYAEKLWEKHGLKPNLVLDLACGTGSLCEELTNRGYDMTGVDASEEMLLIAREKAMEAGISDKILYLQQDMREFELYGTVDSILSTCDSLNYILEEEDLLQVFRLAENYLDQGGLLMFDLNTEYQFREVLGTGTFADTREDAAFIWQNYFYEDEKINEYQVTFFHQDSQSEDRYLRSEETHYEKAYSVETVKRLLEEAQFKVEGIYETFTLNAPTEESGRITFVARELRPKKTYTETEEDLHG